MERDKVLCRKGWDVLGKFIGWHPQGDMNYFLAICSYMCHRHLKTYMLENEVPFSPQTCFLIALPELVNKSSLLVTQERNLESSFFFDRDLVWDPCSGLELGAILLPQSPQCWGDKYVLIQSFSSFCFKAKNHYTVLLDHEINSIAPPGYHQEDVVVCARSQKAVSSKDW